MHQYSEYLRGVYKNLKVVATDKLPPTPSKVYIKLALVKNEMVSRAEANHFTRLTLEGDIDQILLVKEPIQETEIFVPRDSMKFVVLEGAPGIGKSTFAWELCRQWALGNILTDFKLVVLLRLREIGVQIAQNITDLLYHNDIFLRNAIGRVVQESEGQDTLLILDGFDEFPSNLRKSSLVSLIIRGSVLPKATLLVTSRPSARVQLQSMRSFDKHIEVVGFSSQQIMEYAKYYFKERPDILTIFNSYYSLNPIVKAMMYNPLICGLVLDVYRENFISNKTIPHTQTQLYAELTLSLILRHTNAEGLDLPHSLNEFSQDSSIYKQLINISNLALEGRISDVVIFNHLPKGCSSHLGLMNNVSTLYKRREDVTYNFHHLTFQEFMAAYYISQLPAVKQSKWYSSLKGFDVILRFLAGLTKLKHIRIERKRKMMVLRYKGNGEYQVKNDEVRIKTSHVRYFYEMQDVSRCDYLFSAAKCVVQCESPFDVYSVGYSIASCGNAWVVELPWGGYDPELIKTLANGIKSQKGNGGYLEELILGNNRIESIGLEYFNLFPSHILKKIKRLVIFGRKFSAHEFYLLAKTISLLPDLVLLFVYFNPELPVSAVEFFEAVSHHEGIRDLSMINVAINNDTLRALSGAINPRRSVEKLQMKIENTPFSNQLVKILVSKSCLKSVIISIPHGLNLLDMFDTVILGDNLYELEFDTSDYTRQHRFPILYGVCRGFPFRYTSFHTPINLHILQYDEIKITFINTVISMFESAKNLMKLTFLIPLEYFQLIPIVSSLKRNPALKILGLSERYHLHYFSLLERMTLDDRIEWWE